MVHHARHAVGHHAQVLAAGKHPRRAEQLGELALGVAAPELVVAVVEEVVIQRAEALLLPLRQVVGGRRDERLVHARMARIRMEEAVDGQVHEIDLVRRIRQGRVEMAHHSARELDGNLPDAEETEDMVDAERVEIAAHLAQARLPPGEIVLRHLLPVIGREAPVLPVRAEIVGRCAGRGVEVEELRVPVGLRAVGAHADGQVALQRDALGAGVVHFLAELPVQVELHPAIVLRLLLVAPRAELRVLRQPGGVLLDELPAGGRSEVLGAARLDGLADIGHLGLEHARVVQLRQRVERGLRLLEGGVLLDAEVLQVHIERMQGEGGHGAVGIRIRPLALAGGVVDRQQLQDALSRGGGPVHDGPQVAELADAEIVGRAQREHGNRRAHAPEPRPVELLRLMPARERAARDRALDPRILDHAGGPGAVVAPLGPDDQSVVHQHIGVVLERGGGTVLHGHAPDGTVAPAHRVLPVLEDQREALAPPGLILYLESDVHIFLKLMAKPPPGAIVTGSVASGVTVTRLIS